MAKRKNPAAVALAKRRAQVLTAEQRSESARKAGLASGAVRTQRLTPEQRKKIAQKAAASRWGKKGKEK